MQFQTLLVLAAAAAGAIAAPGAGYTQPSTTVTQNQQVCAPEQQSVCCSNNQGGLIDVSILSCVPLSVLGSTCSNTAACCSNIGADGTNDCTTTSGSPLNVLVNLLGDLL